jgi:uncharacterized protein (TIGR00725 family)
MKPPTIVVFGSGLPADRRTHGPAGAAAFATAYELGHAIAAQGWILCNGGYGGTMEAAARGACDAGGHTIGVTCTAFGRSGPNPYIREEVQTDCLIARLDTLSKLGDAYVVLPGGTGTLLELALVWELANKRLLSPVRPIALLGDGWLPVVDVVRREQPETCKLLIAGDITTLIGLLVEHFGQRRGARVRGA